MLIRHLSACPSAAPAAPTIVTTGPSPLWFVTILAVGLIAGRAAPALAVTTWPPGTSGCTDTLAIRDIQDPAASCHPATLDIVLGIRGIVTGFDAKPSAYAVYIQNSQGGAYTGIDVFTGAANYNATPFSLALGDSIVVYGRTQEFPNPNGETEIEGPDGDQDTNDLVIRRISSGNPLPAFQILTPLQMSYHPTAPGGQGEQWEGCLARVRGPLVVVRSTASAGTTERGMPANSFILAPAADTSSADARVLVEGITLTTVSPPVVGTVIDSVQGIPNQRTTSTINTYRVQLRDGDDLFLAAPPNLVNAYAIEDDLLRLEFDRSVDVSSASIASNYSLASGVGVATASVEGGSGRFVRLTSSLPLSDGVGDSVRCESIGSAGCPACLMTPPQSRYFVGGVMTVAAIQEADPAFLPALDRSRFAGPGFTAGATVSFRGICTGVFGNLYYVQDEAGGTRSGVSLFGPPSPLVRGRKYLIAGAHIQEFSQETEAVFIANLVDEGAGTIPPAPSVAISTLASGITTEDYEGMPVHIDAGRVNDVASAGQDFRLGGPLGEWIHEILVANLNGVLDTYDPPDPPTILTVDGIVHEVVAGFRLCPRSSADVVRDLDAPETEITAGPAEGSRQLVSDATFDFRGTDNLIPSAYLRFGWQLDGGGFSAPSSDTSVIYSGLADGAHTFQVRAVDLNDNVDPSPASRTFRVHARPPHVALLTGPAAGSFVDSASAVLAWTIDSLSADASRPATTWATNIDGGGFGSESSDTSLTLSGLAEGQHTVIVRATDDAGLTATATRTWYVDTGAPSVAFTRGPAEGGESTRNHVVFGWAGSDAVAPTDSLTYSTSLDGATFPSPSPDTTVTFNGLTLGPHTFSVRGYDPAGHVSATATRSWTVVADTVPPTSSILTGPAEGSHSNVSAATFTWTGSDNASPPGALEFRYRLDGGDWSAFSFATTVTVDSLSEGSHTFEVMARDEAANEQRTPTARTWTVDLTNPTVSIVTGPAEGAVITTSAPQFVVSGTDNLTATGELEYQHSVDHGPWSPGSTSTSRDLFGLGEGAHTFAVKSLDRAGNESAPLSRGFIVHLEAPSKFVISGPPAYGTQANVSFTFSATSTQAPETIEYAYRMDGGATSAWGPTTKASFNGLSEAAHVFHLKARDAYLFEDSLATPFVVDLTPPNALITDGPAEGSWSNTSSPAFTVSATDNLTPPNLVEFAFKVDGDTLGPFSASTKIALSGLAAGPHTLAVVARDAAGNLDATPATRAWSIDLTPPETQLLTGPSGVVNGDSATFTFTGNDNTTAPGQLRFSTALDNSALGAPSGAATSTLTSLADGAHTFHVAAVDLAGNVDPDPATRGFVSDALPPVIVFTSGPDEGACFAETQANFAWSATDVVTPRAAIQHGWSRDGGDYSEYGSDTTASLTALSEGEHTLSVRSRDALGHVATATRTFRVDQTAPTVFLPTTLLLDSSTFRITCTGTDAGGIVTYRVEVSEDPTFGSVLLDQTIGAAGTTDYNGAQGHTYYARASATDCAGNVSAFSGASNGATIADLPDLVVTQVLVPPTATSGQVLGISYTVANQAVGGTNAPSWFDDVYLSPTPTFDGGTAVHLVRVTNLTFLGQNETYTVTRNVTLPLGLDGTYYVFVAADNGGQVPETIGGNNLGLSSGVSVALGTYANLVVTQVVAPPTALSSETVAVSWTVQNQGSGRTNVDSWWDTAFLSDDPVFDYSVLGNGQIRVLDVPLGRVQHVGGLDPLDQYTGSMQVTIPSWAVGSKYLLVASDLAADGQFQGVSEAGSVFEYVSEVNAAAAESTVVTAQEPPDLVAESTQILTTSATSGGSFTATWTVRNSGFNPTPNTSWADRVWLSSDATLNEGSDLLMGTFSRSGVLGLSQAYTQTQEMGLPNGLSGTFHLFVKTDVHGGVGEYREDNNVAQAVGTLTVSLSPWPNLVPEGGATPDTAAAGGLALVTWNVANRGVAGTYGGWNDDIWISPNPVSTAGGYRAASVRISRALATNQDYAANTTIQLPTNLGGTYYAHLVTDSGNELYEHSNEGDNFATLGSFYVRPYPPVDVAVTAVSLGVSATQTGAGLPVTWTLGNLGLATTLSGSWNEEVWLSTDTNFGGDLFLANSFHGGTLGAGENYTRTFTPTIPPGLGGTYYVFVRTLPAGSDDQNAANDVLAAPTPVTITSIPPPNLTVSAVTAAATDTAGQPLTIRWAVTNLGPGDVVDRTWFSQAYLSRDPLFDGNDVSLGAVQGAANLLSTAAEPESLETTVPSWASGPYYIVVRTDSRNDLYEGGAEFNNVAVSPPLLVYVPPSADLVIQDVVVPPTATPGEPVTITYDIVNVGVNSAVGSLQNGVYVSSNTVFASEEDPLVGIEVRSINLPTGGLMHVSQRVVLDRPITVNAAGGVTGTLPPLTPGPYYAIVRANIRGSVHELNAGNNMMASATTLTADVPALTLGTATPFALASQQERYYKVTTPSGFDLRISLTGDVPDATNEVLVAFGRTPSSTDFDFSSPAQFSASPTIVVPSTEAGVYFIRVRALSLGSSASSEGVSLMAELLPFSVESYSPVSGGAPGRVTLTVHGAGFRNTTELRLDQLGSTVATATMTEFVSTTEFKARLTLSMAAGAYDLVVKTGLDEITIPGGFQVEAARPMAVDVSVHHADVLRRTATGTFVVDFTNPSNQDIQVMTARILTHGASVLKKLETTRGLLSSSERFPGLRDPLSGDVTLLRDCADGDSLLAVDLVAGNLAPGETRTATLGLAGFETSPYSVRVLAQASGVGEYLDREVALHESARQGLLAAPSGVPADVLLLAGDAAAFRNAALVGAEVQPGIVSASDLSAYLLAADAPSPSFPGPAGPQDLLDEAAVGGCASPAGVPECKPDVSPATSALPGCVSVFCTSLPVPLPVGLGPGAVATVVGTSVQGFSTTVSADAKVVVPCDPNELTGPAGYGDQHWVNALEPMSYRVDFENLPSIATAPAQVVRVTVPLDPDLDPTTFRLGSFGFGTHIIDVPPDRTSYSVEPFFSDLGLRVRITCGIDLSTTSAQWTFTSIDPATGLQPTNPYIGFLPVNDPSGSGKGFTTFTVLPRSNTVTGVGVTAQASIKFDVNAPVATSTASNKIDNGKPSSNVGPNPIVIDSTRVRVSWQRNDADGSGVASVALYMRRDHGALEQVATGLTGSELEIPVQPGHYYSFRSQALDNSGNAEPAKQGFDVVVPVGTVVGVATPAPPRATLLFGAAPNPFGNATSARFDLAREEAVNLDVFDVQGRLVQSVLHGKRLEAGHHSVAIRGLQSGPGVYFLRMRAGTYHAVRRMVMLR